eukprot:6184469-Pleurochrysis_carterae.AAC.3
MHPLPIKRVHHRTFCLQVPRPSLAAGLALCPLNGCRRYAARSENFFSRRSSCRKATAPPDLQPH